MIRSTKNNPPKKKKNPKKKKIMVSATISSSSYSPFETNINNVRDDSFSSYLALIRQSFSTELANPGSRRSSFQTIAPAKRTSMDDNDELDVFAAEKYFSGSLDAQDYPGLLVSSNCSSSSKNKKRSTTKSRSSTCSDTSTHSHSILLGRRHQQQQQPSSARRGRSFLDVVCSCCSKKNVVNDAADNSSSKSNSRLPASSRRSPTAVLQSESSSDLFEIESVSMGSLPAVHEPSEPSIEWSAATASADNFSVTSSSVRTEWKMRRRSSSGLLGFGCASEKAVSVTPEKDKVGALERRHVMRDLGSAGHVAAAAGVARVTTSQCN